jgi:hypothetical protein
MTDTERRTTGELPEIAKTATSVKAILTCIVACVGLLFGGFVWLQDVQTKTAANMQHDEIKKTRDKVDGELRSQMSTITQAVEPMSRDLKIIKCLVMAGSNQRKKDKCTFSQ